MVLQTHGQVICTGCGRKVGGCSCKEHQNVVRARLSVCDVCNTYATPIKEILRIEEK